MVYAYTCVIIHWDTLRLQTWVCAHADMGKPTEVE